MDAAVNSTPFKLLDEQAINKIHWRMVFTAGMGFFTDAYDLFIIGVVTSILAPLWHLSITQVSILDSVSLASAAFGAVFFGCLADKFGRKKLYGVEMGILFVGAILSAISFSFGMLLVSRIIIGLGIGGDYPTSAVVASEYANRKNRGFLVLIVFAMQALGLVVGPLVASLLLSLHIPHEIIWRSLFALGAIPAAIVFHYRRKISETPRFMHFKYQPAYPIFSKQKLFTKKWIRPLLCTASTWFLIDIALYGNVITSSLIMKAINPHSSLLKHTFLTAILFLCFALPGYLFSALYVDKVGRNRLQTIGFIIMAICYASIAFVPEMKNHLTLFLCIFGLSFFFVNFGPNTTTFLIPSEIFPTNIRARAHGISAAVGKIGAALGVFLLPCLLNLYGLSFTMEMIACVSICGAIITQVLPEMSKISLERSEIFLPGSELSDVA